MVDAAGAIYVIGGNSGPNFLDVWASTDGGARAGLRQEGVVGWVLQWILIGVRTQGVLQGYSGVLRGTKGVLGGTKRVLWDTEGY